MRKLLTALLLWIYTFTYSQDAIVEPSLKTDELIGKVKSVIEKQVSFSEDGERFESRHILMEYNTSGKQISYKFVYNIKKNQFSLNLRRYDNNQNLLEVNMYTDSVLVEKRLYEYDSQNRVIKESLFNGKGNMFQKTLFSYDTKGHLLEKQLWMSDTYFLLKQTYEYDKNGNNISLKNYNSKNVLTYEYSYVYDKNNNKIQQVHKKLNDPEVEKVIRIYDNQNQPIKVMYYTNDKLVSESIHINQNHITAESTHKSITKNSKYVTRYNEKGLLIETQDYQNDVLKVKQTYWYEYDEEGNWVKKFNSYNGESPTLTEREIEYF